MPSPLEQYKKAYIILPDVWAIKGTDIVREFSGEEKDNLIVVSLNIVRELEKRKQEGSLMAAETLKFLSSTTGKKPIELYEDNYGAPKDKLYKSSQGDILVINPETHQSAGILEKETGEISLHRISQSLDKTFKGSELKKLTTIVTANTTTKMILENGQNFFNVETPDCLFVNPKIVYSGLTKAPDNFFDKLRNEGGSLDAKLVEEMLEEESLTPHQIIATSTGDKYAIVRANFHYDSKTGALKEADNFRVELIELKNELFRERLRIGGHSLASVLGITPRNNEQALALQYGIFNEHADIVFITGKKGSGKTTTTSVGAVELVTRYNWYTRRLRHQARQGMPNAEIMPALYDKIYLFTPDTVTGLPGELDSSTLFKLENFRIAHGYSKLASKLSFAEMFLDTDLVDAYSQRRSKKSTHIITPFYNWLSKRPVMTLGTFENNTLPNMSNCVIIVDDAQNIPPEHIHRILNHRGQNSKLIITGDSFQATNVNCGTYINGLTSAINDIKDQPNVALFYLPTSFNKQEQYKHY